MFQQLLKIRFLVLVLVVVAVVHALAFMALGIRTALHAYGLILAGAKDIGAGRPGVELLHSLDTLFISMVLIVLALGMAKLFLRSPADHDDSKLPVWLRIESITELKVLIWETVLTTLLIVAMSDISSSLYEPTTWTILITPAAVLLLAISLFFIKKR
ncbi:MAG TPA: YqhA family protein [Polyangia bacterium]|nr:YqhA family protein [Polyangia bacterium]